MTLYYLKADRDAKSTWAVGVPGCMWLSAPPHPTSHITKHPAFARAKGHECQVRSPNFTQLHDPIETASLIPIYSHSTSPTLLSSKNRLVAMSAATSSDPLKESGTFGSGVSSGCACLGSKMSDMDMIKEHLGYLTDFLHRQRFQI
jgi:hypothetical protein